MARKTKNPSDTSSLMKSSTGTLAQIAAKTNSLTILADIVRQTCPDLPAEVWHIANFKQNSIVIEVISATWGQRLQFERVNISQKLAQVSAGEFNQIEIKVSPYRNQQPIKQELNPPIVRNISQKTAQQLNEIAENAPESLKKKLQKLASLANKSH
ncbi:MAG: DciA family protein [Thalassotalea sp.]|nr:DciA family protein [Thalassotalea sp.]